MRAGTTYSRVSMNHGEMEPAAFCRAYCQAKEDTWGYKTRWKTLLAHVLGVSPKTVELWGPDYELCPVKYKQRLAILHALKAAEGVLRAHDLHKDYLDSL